MGYKAYLRKCVDYLVKPQGYQLIASGLLYDWQKHPQTEPSYKPSALPKEAAEYLQPGNPRLRTLQARYAAFDQVVTTPLVWTSDHVRVEDILYFRGDNAYVWQLRGENMNIMGYALTTFYLKSRDALGLLAHLDEDDLFGNYTFDVDGRVVSRDLLDSVMEIYFLEKHLKVSASPGVTILDIGAGYGRLAHRVLRALPNVGRYLCTDAVAVSSFIAEYYLGFREVNSRAAVVPLDEIDRALEDGAVNIAVNVHSFSECSLSAIDWWVALLEKHRVRYLMIVPNSLNHGGKLLLTNDHQDFSGVLTRHGYKLVARDPKYGDPIVQRYAINPTYHYLFELQ